MSDNEDMANPVDPNINDDGFETLNDVANDCIHRSDIGNLGGQPPHQQARYVLQPFDNTISNHPVFWHP
eukprot:11034422-Ditylum_brightwellii.AAC.1